VVGTLNAPAPPAAHAAPGRRLRIAQVVVTYPPYRGGIGNVAHAYAEGLRARGHEVDVFTPAYGGAPVEQPGVHRLRARVRAGQFALLPQLAHCCAGYDVVHLHFPFFGAAGFVAWARARGRIARLVLTYHMDAHASGLRGAAFACHRRLVLPWTVRQADRILVSSRDYAAHAALGRLADLQDRVEEHPFGVDATRFHPGPAPAARARLALRDAPTVTFVGGLDRAHAFKGVGVLLQAAARLDRDVQLVLVGDGDLREAYRRQAVALGLGERARFLGGLADADLPDAYRAADVVVLPSVGRGEAFGLVALEAAACARPVVASDLPGVRTVVREGATGKLVPPGDVGALAEALADLLADAARAQALGTAARTRVEAELTLEHALDRLLASYARLLAA